MSDFLRQFLRDDPRTLAGDTRAVFLGVFGKHPGWDDHIEEMPEAPDLGIRTPSLVLARQSLYVNGIGRMIDTGAWEALEPGHRLESFDHWFFWSVGDQFIAGRLWSSQDGKGRSRYPMIVAAHLMGMSLDWTLAAALPRLAALQLACLGVTSASGVAAAVVAEREALRGHLTDPRSSIPVPISTFVGADEGLLRVWYQLELGGGPYASGRFSPKANNLPACELRGPRLASGIAGEVAAWTLLCRAHLDAAVPLLLLLPDAGDWVDVIAGEPVADDWLCLRATPSRLPRASDIPFNLDAEFRARARAALAGLAQAPETSSDPAGGAGGVRRFFGSLFKRT